MSLNTTAPSYVTGQVVTAAQLNALQDGIQANWTPYTLTTTNMTLGTGGTAAARYLQIGKTFHFRMRIVLGTGGSMGTNPTMNLPTTINSTLGGAPSAQALFVDTGINSYAGYAQLSGSSVGVFVVGTNGLAANVTATAPFTWGAGDELTVSGTFEAA